MGCAGDEGVEGTVLVRRFDHPTLRLQRSYGQTISVRVHFREIEFNL